MGYYYPFGVFFLILVNYYFQDSFNLKAILFLAKICQIVMTELPQMIVLVKHS